MPIAQRKTEEPEMLAAESVAVNPRATLGDNKPPVEEVVAAEFREELLRNRPDFMDRYNGVIAAVGRAAVTDDETLGKAGDLEKIMRACDGHIAETHRSVKEPYLKAGRTADAEKNNLTAPLYEAKAKLKDMMNGYMADREARERKARAEREAEERRLAEEARAAEIARQEAEGINDPEAIAAVEAAPLAAAIASRPAPVRSDAGATVSGKQVWNSQVEDYGKALKAVKSDPKVKEAIDAAVARLVRAGQRELPGVRIWATVQAVAR